MRLNIVAGLLTTLLMAGCAVSQAPQPADEHAGHHPGGAQGGGLAIQSVQSGQSAAAPATDAFDRQMKAMQEMHRKMQAAKTPAERAALMDEHMKVMQSGMVMMGSGRSGGMGMMQRGAQAPSVAPAAPEGAGMSGMMGMHAQMERRMALMEQMMQMMVDRQAATPPR
jgi:hypothetical protein